MDLTTPIVPNTPEVLQALELRQRLVRAPHEHKGHAGKVLIIGGDVGMSGAVFLSGQAALYGGAGWIILGLLDPRAPALVINQPELMLKSAHEQLLSEVSPDVVAIGPGLGHSALARQLLEAALINPSPLILDADAINLLASNSTLIAKLKARPAGLTVLTPHPGEAARLLHVSSEEVQADRLGSLHKLVQLTGAIIVLKGQNTLIASPANAPQVCLDGNPGMGVGGMGDVLTGLMAAILAQGLRHDLSVFEATGLAVQLHAQAADQLVNQGVGPIGLTPMEVILKLRDLINIK